MPSKSSKGKKSASSKFQYFGVEEAAKLRNKIAEKAQTDSSLTAEQTHEGI
jgi:hypothetical protein